MWSSTDKCLALHTKRTKLQWNNYQDLLQCYDCRRGLRRFNCAVGGCFLPGLLGKLLVQSTTNTTAQFPRWRHTVQVLCPITQVWLGSILSLLWSVVCVASPALSSACLFKIYCTTETCKFYDSRDSNLYSPFNENYPSYFFLMEKD